MRRWLLVACVIVVASTSAATSLYRLRRTAHAPRRDHVSAARAERTLPRVPLPETLPHLPIIELGERLHYVSAQHWTRAGASYHSRALGWVRLPQLPERRKPIPADASSSTSSHYVGPKVCGECHPLEYAGYRETAHAVTSQDAATATLPGAYEAGSNRLDTRVDSLSFVMETRPEGAFQKVVVRERDRIYSHAEHVDIVTGSGNHGQTYLYWKEDFLYELPVTWFSATAAWMNSPGFADGTADFSRPVPPRCLECHATHVRHVPGTENRYVRDSLQLGISCERCHGPGSLHVDYHRQHADAERARFVVHPGRLPRDRLNEVCAQCHSGAGVMRLPSFSFRPGQRLADAIAIDHSSEVARGGVHTANQLARLSMSRCFTESDKLTCASCHDPHRNEHGKVATFSARCIDCHTDPSCTASRDSAEVAQTTGCIDCHMPESRDEKIDLQGIHGRTAPVMRDHFIRVLPAESR